MTMLLKNQIINFGDKLSKEEWTQKIREFNFPKCPHAQGEEWLCAVCAQEAINTNSQLREALDFQMNWNTDYRQSIDTIESEVVMLLDDKRKLYDDLDTLERISKRNRRDILILLQSMEK